MHDDSGDSGGAVVTAPAFVDSRQLVAGGLFVAVVGEQVDGHDFAASACAAGAAGVLGARPTGVPTVVVDDPVPALGRLARHVVARLPATVLALTGSQGKTGTKDLLAQVLASEGATVWTEGNQGQESASATHRAARHPRHAVPRPGDGRPRRRPHRRAVRDRTAPRRRCP